MATNLENYEKYGGASGEASLKGIVKVEKNEQGIVGLEIQDLLSINNYKVDATGTEVLPTNGNLCLRDYTADLLRADNPNIIELTYVKTISIETISIKIYQDSNGGFYRYGPDQEEGHVLVYISGGDNPEQEGEILPLTVAPNWNKDSVFKLSDENKEVYLRWISYLLFENTNTSTIITPKTINTYFGQVGICKNFSGTLDISNMNPITEENPLDLNATNFENCTEGTILVNAEQYTAVSSRISGGMLDGTIKIQQVENGGES